MNKAGVTNPIHVASDGQQAIDYLKGTGKFSNRRLYPLPALVLLDLKLPHVMGLDVLKWIRAQNDLPLVVVMLTASAEQPDIATAYRLRANGFLVKPSESNRLEDMARAIRDFWLTHNTFPPEPVPESPMEGVVTLGNSSNHPGSKQRAQQNGRPPNFGPTEKFP
jgi:CheY-like chemotaxis protein